MIPLLEIYWPYLLVALAIGLGLAWFLFSANRKTRVTSDNLDVLDEGAAPASRNQALIDAAPAGHAGAGVAATAAAQQAMVEAQAETQAGNRDDLTRIKGLGQKLAILLDELGVTRFEQIAGWDDAEIDRIDAQLGRFEGRIRRDNWVEQAKLLAAGENAAFEATFGNS